MTICNMCIEGGARAGLIAPDDTTFEYVARPAARARRARPGTPPSTRWRTLPTDDGATYDKTITIDAGALEPMVTYGTNPGMGIPITSRVPSPADAGRPGRAARPRAGPRVHGPPARPGDPRPEGRRRVHRVVHERPDQRPAPRGRGPQGSPRRRRRPDDDRAGLRRGEARGRARGPRTRSSGPPAPSGARPAARCASR